MSLELHLIYKEHTYYIYNHLSLNMNSLNKKSKFNLDSREIKISPRGKRANTLNKGVKGGERVNN
jgi:hypothetical protein